MHGGEGGARGQNLLLKNGNHAMALPPKCQLKEQFS